MTSLVVYYPSGQNYNPYNSKMQNIITTQAFYVVGFSSLFTWNMLKKIIFEKVRPKYVVNWFEDYFFNKDGSVSFSKFIVYVSILVFMKITGKIFYVKHNYKKHLVSRVGSFFSRLSYYLIELFSYKMFVHSKYFSECTDARFKYIPHPLYFDYTVDNGNREDNEKVPYFICFGRITKYKGYDNLIKYWPKGYKLIIAGEAESVAYSEHLLDIVQSRNVDVSFINNYLSDDELLKIVRMSNGVVLAHEPGTCIISGSAIFSMNAGIPVLVDDDGLLLNIGNGGLAFKLNEVNLDNLSKHTLTDDDIRLRKFLEEHSNIRIGEIIKSELY